MFSPPRFRRILGMVEEQVNLRRAQLDRAREEGADTSLLRQSVQRLEATAEAVRITLHRNEI
jgi:hypothetical protein